MYRRTRGRWLQKDNAESPDCPSESALPTCAGSRWSRLHHLPCSLLWPNRKTTHSVQGAIRPKFSRGLDVAAVDIQVVEAAYFRSMQLRAADKQMNQRCRFQWKASVKYVLH